MSVSISVVMPYYNGSRFVGEALESIRKQTRAPFEIIVVDDASRPEEADALDRQASDCTLVRLPKNRGPSVARNLGIARARGEWIAFLDCDDVWHPEKLERQLALIESNPDCRAVHCGMKTVWPDGKETVNLKSEITLNDFLIFPCAIFPSAVLMQRQALFECGLFDPTMGVCHDLDLFLRFCTDGGRFLAVPEALVTRRIQSDGVSRNIASFWNDADRVYRDFLSTFADQRSARAALREVHTDMALRAAYARDFRLAWRMLSRATRRDVPLPLILSRVAWRMICNRLQR